MGSDPSTSQDSFRYYLPHVSTSTTDLYTGCDWMAFSMIEPNEYVETEALLFTSPDEVQLPYINEDHFNYYPTSSEVADASTDEEGVRGSQDNERRKIRKLQRRTPSGPFWFEKKMNGFLKVFGNMKINGKTVKRKVCEGMANRP